MDLPVQTGHVIDQASLLTASDKTKLENKLKNLEGQTKYQFAILTVKSLDGASIENFARHVLQAWKLGQANQDKGALLIIAPTEHEARIEVGMGLKKTLTTAFCKDTIDKAVSNFFRTGQFQAGIDQAADAIVSKLQWSYGREKLARFAPTCDPLKRQAEAILKSAGAAPGSFDDAFERLGKLRKQLPSACPKGTKIFGGTVVRVVPCYNQAIYIELADGERFVWTKQTDTLEYGRPGRIGNFAMGITKEPYYCLSQFVPVIVWSAPAIQVMAQRSFDPGDMDQLLADRARRNAQVNESTDSIIAGYNQKLAHNPKDVPVLLARGNAYLRTRNYISAISDFDRAVAIQPDNAVAWNDRCWARAISNRELDQALVDCNRSLRLKPGEANTLDSRGLVYLRQGELDKAMADYDSFVVGSNWNMTTSLYGRGLAEQTFHNPAAGEMDIAAARAVSPDISEVFASYGIPPAQPQPLKPTQISAINPLLMFPFYDGFVDAFYWTLSNYGDQVDANTLIKGGIDGLLKAAGETSADFDVKSRCGEFDRPEKDDEKKYSSLFSCFLLALNQTTHKFAPGEDIPKYKQLMHAAVDGVLKAAGSRVSYIDSNDDESRGNQPVFGGLGASVALAKNGIRLTGLFPGGAAIRSGLETGDVVTKVNGVDLKGMALKKDVGKLTGPIGSTVRLTIRREGLAQPLVIDVARDIIFGPVHGHLHGKEVVYIRISDFNRRTAGNLKAVIDGLNKAGSDHIKGYILDLRSDKPGFLHPAIAVADTFLNSGKIASTESRNLHSKREVFATAGDPTNGKPLIVLINHSSTGAAELVAAALKDDKRATIVGSNSGGVARINAIVPLGPGHGELELPAVSFLPPSGRSIQGKGVAADIKVEQHGKPSEGPDGLPKDAKDDDQLQSAIALIRGTKKNRAFPAHGAKTVAN